MCKPQSHKRSFSVIPPHLSKEGEGKKRNLWSERGKNDITRQIQNNSFTVTSLTFLRFPVKWKPADIHFASPAIVRSGRPAYPSCCAAWASHPGGFSLLAHHSHPALLLLCPWQVVLRGGWSRGWGVWASSIGSRGAEWVVEWSGVE